MNICIFRGGPVDGSAYLAEILHAFGLCFVERGSIQQADPRTDLILLTRGADPSGIEAFLHAGGSVIAIHPDESLERLAGLVRQREVPGPWRMRLSQPVCYGARGEPLWTFGPLRLYEPKYGPNVHTFLFDPDNFQSETIGIIECAVGAGKLIVFAYDPAQCIARLRQGDPSRANFLPPGLPTPRATFLHQADPPEDTAWRPTADLHAQCLCEMVRRALGANGPVPTLWHIPEGHPSILLFSGDEDASAQEANDRQMRDVESFGGAMSLYVIHGNTSITREHIAEYTRRGHTISVHPDLLSTAKRSPGDQLARAGQEVRSFQEKFGQPVRTLRNHHYMWPGYVDLPEVWERLGVGMDANTTATLYGMSLASGPYVNIHSAVPLRFVRQDGSLIDVFQQPTHINDDIISHPRKAASEKYTPEQWDWIVERLLDDATRYFHGPICANFHPCNYVDFSGEHGRLLMRRVRERGLPIWSLDRWHDWWRARSTWRTMSIENRDGQMCWMFKGDRCSGLAVRFAAEHAITDVHVNGAPSVTKRVRWNGRDAVEVPLPDDATECTVRARAASGE